MPIKFPGKVDLAHTDDEYYHHLGKQDMAFHQTLGELVDNAISAAGKDQEGDMLPFRIEVVMDRVGEQVGVMIGDDGIGIGYKELTGVVLRTGGKGRSQGPFNEHGFGLKNALCVMTAGNRLPFTILTRDDEAAGQGAILKVQGPFKHGMEVVKGTDAEFGRSVRKLQGKTGTRVAVVTTLEYMRTAYPKARKHFKTLIPRIQEHIGVMYRLLLRNDQNKIWIRWRDLGDDPRNPVTTAQWDEWRVVPIEIPFVPGSLESTIAVSADGKTASATFRSGLVDVEKVKKEDPKPYPLQIYYQPSIRSQGIDICVRGRVIGKVPYNHIWEDCDPHQQYNEYAAELILPQQFATVNNKISLDPNDALWQALKEKLQVAEYENHKPSKQTRQHTEKEYRDKLKALLEGTAAGNRITVPYPVWAGVGIAADIANEFPNGDLHLYELKVGQASPDDVYQVVMYWDGAVIDGKNPTVGWLIADSAADSVKGVVRYYNTRTDARNKKYLLEFRTWADLKISI